MDKCIVHKHSIMHRCAHTHLPTSSSPQGQSLHTDKATEAPRGGVISSGYRRGVVELQHQPRPSWPKVLAHPSKPSRVISNSSWFRWIDYGSGREGRIPGSVPTVPRGAACLSRPSQDAERAHRLQGRAQTARKGTARVAHPQGGGGTALHQDAPTAGSSALCLIQVLLIHHCPPFTCPRSAPQHPPFKITRPWVVLCTMQMHQCL